MPDFEVIYLQAEADADYTGDGRLWCQDDVWSGEPGNAAPTKYVRADIAEARERAAADGARREVGVVLRDLVAAGCKVCCGRTGGDWDVLMEAIGRARNIISPPRDAAPSSPDPNPHLAELTAETERLGLYPGQKPDPVAAARETVVKAAMAWHEAPLGTFAETKAALHNACAALAALESKP